MECAYIHLALMNALINKKGEIIHLANGRTYALAYVNIVEVQTGYHDYSYQWEAHYQNQNAPYDMVVYKKDL